MMSSQVVDGRGSKVACVALLLVLMLGAGLGVRGWFYGGRVGWMLDGDEVITLDNYTWAGLTKEGERRPIRRIEDLYALERPTPRQVVMGMYCSFGRWLEPNNHVINSAMMNVSLAMLGGSEWAMRTPALLGAVAFAVMIGAICWIVFRNTAAVVLGIIFVTAHPYIADYSLGARGYTLMLAMQAAMLLMAFALARRPRSIVLGLLLAVLAVMSAMNVVSLSADWIAPFYLAMCLVMPSVGARDQDQEEAGEAKPRAAVDHATLRYSAVVQALGVGAVGFVFLMDRLPMVVSSAGQYGLPFEGLGGFAHHVRGMWNYLFPTWAWSVWAALSLAGLALMLREKRTRFVAAVAWLAIGVTMLHFLGTHKFAYYRTCGHFLPLLFVGFSGLIVAVNGWIRPAPVRAAVWGAALIAAVAMASVVPPSDPDWEQLTQLGKEARAEPPAPEGLKTVAVVGDAVDRGIVQALPPAWMDATETLPIDEPLRVCVWLRQREEAIVRLRAAEAQDRPWRPAAWSLPGEGRLVETYRYVHITGRTHAFEGGVDAVRAMVFWYPDPLRQPTSPELVYEKLERAGARFRYEPMRVQLKMMLCSVTRCVIFIAESPEQSKQMTEAVRWAMGEYGGSAVVFVPQDQPTATPATAPAP